MLGADKYTAVYLCWFATVTIFCIPVALGSFPELTTFERVGASWLFALASWGAVAIGSCAVAPGVALVTEAFS